MAETKQWTVREVVAWITDDLRSRGIDGPRLDAELIVAQALGVDRVKILVDPMRLLEASELEAIRALVKRRRAYEPLAYLRGYREFYGRPFRVDARVLVPRPDTELLVEVGLRSLAGRELAARVADLCTGSGCVAVTLKCERPLWDVDAVDLSPDAVAVARDNAARLGAQWKLRIVCGDLFAPLGVAARRYDLVTANPPYIAHGEIAQLQPDIRLHEPHISLDGGSDGLEIVRRIVLDARERLRPGGVLAMEIGAGQAPEVMEFMTRQGYSGVDVTRDYGGIERVVHGTLG